MARVEGIQRVEMKFTYLGGPTVLIDWNGIRMMTDPSFDAGFRIPAGFVYTSQDTRAAMSANHLGKVDLVLLSHDHHFDNLDRAGREFLRSAKTTITTAQGAQDRILRVTATPARHGPEGKDRVPVIGFAAYFMNFPEHVLYVSGDTVWHDGMAEIARRYAVRVAVLFMGAANVPEVGPWRLTLTAEEAVEAARAFPKATIVPVHYEGWVHYSESREYIADTFRRAGLDHRLRWLPPGVATVVGAD